MTSSPSLPHDGLILGNDGIPKAGKKEKIFNWIVDKNSDLEILDKFLYTFPEVIKPEVIWSMLEGKYNSLPKIPRSNLDPNEIYVNSFCNWPGRSDREKFSFYFRLRLTPKFRVVTFLWYWIDRCLFRDFLNDKENNLYQKLLDFLKSLNPETAIMYKLLILKKTRAKSQKMKMRRIRPRKNSQENNSEAATEERRSSDETRKNLNHSSGERAATPLEKSPSEPIPSPAKPRNTTKMISGGGSVRLTSSTSGKVNDKLQPGKFEFHDLSPDAVANQLTLIEWGLKLLLVVIYVVDSFSFIQESELLHLNWKNEGSKKTLASNVVSLVDRFNAVSYWVATEIMMQSELLVRAKTVKKFIQVAQKLRAERNFNGVMEIVGGLNLFPVQRLKQTWEEVGDAKKFIDELDNLMDTKGNYRNYRAALRTVEPPTLPYLGVFLRDLLFIEEGNPDFKEDEMINFEKLMLIGDVITQIKYFQSKSYEYPSDPLLQDYLVKISTLPEEMLYKHSLLCEGPRGEEKSAS